MTEQAKHTPGLSFDGKGINGPDTYRARLATFQSDEAAECYGCLFAAAPETAAERDALRELCGELAKALEDLERTSGLAAVQDDPARVAARAALARAREMGVGK